MNDMITVEFIVVTVTLLALAIGMFHQTRCMRRDVRVDTEKKAMHEAKINSTLERVSEQLTIILQRLDTNDKEMRSFAEWKIRTEVQIINIEERVKTAFTRTDQRKAGIDELRREFQAEIEKLRGVIPHGVSLLQS